MVWWIVLAVFLASVLDDILYVFFVRRIMDGSRLSAALLSGALTMIVSLEGYAQYAVHPGYIVANAFGSSVGCPLAMYIEEKWPRKKPREKKTGKFKPVIGPASFQRGDKK
jgi:uncharacterized protein YebE (UPF0316 family)